MDKKLEVLRKISRMNPDEPTHLQMISFIEANLLQLEVAERLEHDFVNGQHFDAISKNSKRLYEYKIVNSCNTKNMTISNLNNKEDVIVFVNKNVIDSEEHWFFFTKEELQTKRSPCGTFKLVDDKLTRGKMMLPLNYLSHNRRTWKKDYLMTKRVTVEQLKQITNSTL